MGVLYDLYRQVMERKNHNEDGNEGRPDTHKGSRQCPIHDNQIVGEDEVEQTNADTQRTGRH